MAEAQAGYILDALEHMRANRLATVEPQVDAQRSWNRALQRRMKGTVWTEGGCSSWYLDRNGLNTSLWPDFSFRFVRALRRFEASEHALTRAPATDRGAGRVPAPV